MLMWAMGGKAGPGRGWGEESHNAVSFGGPVA